MAGWEGMSDAPKCLPVLGCPCIRPAHDPHHHLKLPCPLRQSFSVAVTLARHISSGTAHSRYLNVCRKNENIAWKKKKKTTPGDFDRDVKRTKF